MSLLTIDEGALRHNLSRVWDLLGGHHASLSVVTKNLCGHVDTIAALRENGVDFLPVPEDYYEVI